MIDPPFQHIVARITGDANGIGKTVVEKVVSQGGKVVLTDISRNGAKVFESMGDKTLFTCNDGRMKAVRDSTKRLKDKFGGVDVLVNSTSVLGSEPTYDFENKKARSVDLYRCLFDANARRLFNVTLLFDGWHDGGEQARYEYVKRSYC
ncbi:unnamed protein product [Xylocopa violacea]|uniref:Uncharacterized protein n=1 Tax=Xylocopa violacea TaxID=135666 RepID=A0ABP1PCW6_XYLVO